MRNIYKIVNNENGKFYVGQTGKPITERLNEHYVNRKQAPDREMYADMIKYGKKAFSVVFLEQVDDDLSNERERYWIEKLDALEKGYNSMVGGDFMPKLTKEQEQKIIDLYHETQSGIKTADITKHATSTVYKVLKDYNVELYNDNLYFSSSKHQRRIRINELDLEFDSITKAAEHLIYSGYTNSKRTLGIIQNIYFVLSGQRKHYKKMTFSYLD